ncbi:DUF2071 domain-containing protein [Sphingobacterium sp. SRCM116780]|uniref:DUF2071 domain-containing protein n=1 Tax=Sphingobacterium sp. SRCM116780 TaxID=2907623 RepID=UPI001F1FB45D|nr:DUF2071 domain-containing protein [Sphingobacterium sp. SRCM116780]UIR56805.1 DUF2071 domain-containing protein [Sphingobacterium sp. SRCM116780]
MEKTTEIHNCVKNISRESTFTVATQLRHFSIVTYLVPIEKLRRVIPLCFDIYTITIEGKHWGMVSAVTFIDKDFHFKNILPFWKLEFPQTNYRAYIINKTTGENCVWFFGTGLGSRFVFIPQKVWKMPWFLSTYETNFEYTDKYTSYQIEITAQNANANIDIIEDSVPRFITEDFSSAEEARLVLTHPVTGYFKRSDNYIGSYKIWHPLMEISTGQCKNAYFEKFEKLELLTIEQMKHPYSVLLTKEIDFVIELPPQKLAVMVE